MSRFTKVGLTLAAVIILGCVFILPSLLGVSSPFQPRKTPAPDGFVASQFQDLSVLQSTDQMRVVNLNTLGDAFHPGLMPSVGVLYITVSTGPYTSFYLFFDSKGREIGRRDKLRSTFPIGNTIIEIDGYYTVKPNTLGDKKTYVDVDGGDLVPMEKMQTLHAQSTYFYTASYYDFPRDTPEYEQKINTHLFQIDGVWMRARAVNGTHLEWKTAPFPDFTTQYRFLTDTAPQSETHFGDSSFFGRKYAIDLTWFDQQEYFRRRAASIGSPTGQGRPEHWRGTGYYTVRAAGKSIGFAIPNDMQRLSPSGPVSMRVLGHETLDLVMIEHFAGRTPQYYIISTTD